MKPSTGSHYEHLRTSTDYIVLYTKLSIDVTRQITSSYTIITPKPPLLSFLRSKRLAGRAVT